jgi:pyruvate dehydrogenase E2 component (dihydrolipoamide acetyltransferase)
MAYEFHLPDIGEGLTEAVVVEWLVKVGDELALDAPMVEMETDKAVTEIPAPHAGVVLYLGAAEGDTVEIDELLVVIGEPGEQWEPSAEPEPEAAPIVGTLPEAPPAGAGVEAVPVARRLAKELGVDLATVAGSGPGGRITEDDVAAAAGGGAVEKVELSPTRRAIAEHLTKSWREIPHVTTYAEANAVRLLARRNTGLPLEALLIALIVPVLKEHPEFNASWGSDSVLLRKHYDIGFAVDTPDGLKVAVVKGADRREAADIGHEVIRLATAVRERTASIDELRGATFTVSNIGAVGGGFGTPIIPYGTSAILSVGRGADRPVVRAGEVVVAPMFPLSLSYDHRVIDGALGRRFMAALVEAIEQA